MPTHETTGTLERVDLGTGAWVLVDDHGERWQLDDTALDGGVPADLAGRRVHVSGRPVESLGFAMVGPTLAVRRIRRA